MGYTNITDGSITPTPPTDPGEIGEMRADEQFANVFWQWGGEQRGGWLQHRCLPGTVFNVEINVCVLPQDFYNQAPYVLNDDTTH